MNEELIVKHLAGETEAHENALIQNWINSSEENEKIFRDYERIWSNSKAINPLGKIDVDKAWSKVNAQISQEKNTKVFPLSKVWLAAASLILLLGVSLALFNVFKQEPMLHLSANKQQDIQYKLGDGTEVILREGNFSFPEEFNQSQRTVLLENGTAFFKVAKDASKPFVIELGQAKITVLGTQFELRKSASSIQVRVKEGKVKFSSQDGERILVANQAVNYQFQSHQIKDEEIKDENAFSYVSKSLHFNELPLNEVVESLNQYYSDRSIVLAKELKDCKLSANFENEKLENVLEVIKATMNVEVRWDQKNNSYIIEGKGCTP
jgi:ferric-dicitrate binding protein FerR (iron transport regulator)